MLHNTPKSAPNFENQYLDILYQNKNKDYGGYELRKNYTRRLGRSVIIAFAILAIVLVNVVFNKAEADNRVTNKPTVGSHKYTEVTFIKPRVIKPKIEKPTKSAGKTPIKTPAIKTKTPVTPRTARLNVVDTRTATLPTLPTAVTTASTGVTTTSTLPTSGPTSAIPSGGGGTASTTASTTATTGNTIKGSTQVDQIPLYPGGEAALNAFLSKNLEYPEEARQHNAEAEIEIFFVVDIDGSIQQISCNNKDQYGFVTEGKRVVGKMPKWKPAMVGGKPVKCYFSVPINYVLQDDDK
jgi:periplasmic protein TonB